MSKTEPIPPDASILHISERAWDLGKNYAAEIAINANVCKTLEALISEIRVRSNLKYQQSVHKRVTNYSRTNWRSKRKNLIAQTQTITPCLPMNCQRLMMVIANNISDDAVIVEEGLSSTTTLLNFLSISQRNRFFGLASGGIGFATAGAIGVSLAIPSRPIIAVIGDGSIMYSIQALWTAAHLDLPITYLILNNKGYKILKERLKSFRSAENYVGMVLEKPLIDFVSLAKSLGVPARKATSEQEICDILKFADDRAGPLLLDIDV